MALILVKNDITKMQADAIVNSTNETFRVGGLGVDASIHDAAGPALEEALRRIREYEGLKRIIVGTNSNLAAPRTYEAAGFVLYDRKPNLTESAYTGDYLYYEIIL